MREQKLKRHLFDKAIAVAIPSTVPSRVNDSRRAGSERVLMHRDRAELGLQLHLG